MADSADDESVARRYERIFEGMGDGVYVLDADGRLVECNDFMVELTGYDRETIEGFRVADWYDDEDVAAFERAIRDLLAGQGPDVRTVEATLERADGDEVPIEVNLTLLPREEGEFRGTVGVVRDITERRERERQLEQYETVVETVPDGVFVVDDEGHIVDGNDTAARMFGEDPDEEPPDSFVDFVDRGIVDENLLDQYEAGVRRLLSSETDDEVAQLEYPVTLDGERRIYEGRVALRPYEEEFRGVIGIVRDVTDRRQRERALERYETVVEASGDGMYTLDEEGRYTFMNRANADLLGYEPEELIGEHVSTVMDEADIERSEELIRNLLTSDRKRETLELELTTQDGERLEVEAHIGLLPAPDGEFRGTVGISRDITERKERERALERYETIIEATGDQVYTLDPDGHFTYVNEAMASFTGYDESQLLGEHVSIAMDEADVERGEVLIRDLLRHGDRRRGTFEMNLRTADGRRVPTENHVALLVDEEGEFHGTTGVIRDISERKERERRLQRQNERLERFAGMLSHDLRNPLNMAVGYLQMADEGSEGVDLEDYLEKTREALDRMDDIIQDVLSLAREGQQVVEPDRVDIAACARAAWDTVETGGATLSLGDDLGSVLAEETRLQRLFENIFRNCIDHVGDDVAVRVGRLDGGFYVVDDGPGIPEDERADVFEYGKTGSEDGTGLGLAIVRTIAETHGWEVGVTDGADGGARFEFEGVESA